MKQLLDEYRGRVRLVVKFAPYPYRDHARLAARAALAAAEQGKFWEMHEALLQNYRILNPGKIAELAAALGMDLERFGKGLASETLARRVEDDAALARSLDLYQTPTFVIGPTGKTGRVVVGERPIEHLRRMLDEELAAAGGGP